MKLSSKRKKQFMTERYLKQEGLCFLCGLEMLLDTEPRCPRTATLDHIFPLCKGGTWNKTNLVLACHKCNHSKSNIVIPEYILDNKDYLYSIFRNQKVYKVSQTW